MKEQENKYHDAFLASEQERRMMGSDRGNSLVETIILNIYPKLKNHPRFEEFLQTLESTNRTGIYLYRSFSRFNHFLFDTYHSQKKLIPENIAELYLQAILENNVKFEGQSLDEMAKNRVVKGTFPSLPKTNKMSSPEKEATPVILVESDDAQLFDLLNPPKK